MYAAVSEVLQSEGESVQQRWLMAQNMEESVLSSGRGGGEHGCASGHT